MTLQDLIEVRRGLALETLAQDCRKRMVCRWPEVDFDSKFWPIKTLYGTTMLDLRLTPLDDSFSASHTSYALAGRCLLARAALSDSIKVGRNLMDSWRLLQGIEKPLALLCRSDLESLEQQVLLEATSKSAGKHLLQLGRLRHMLDEVARLGIIDHLLWSIDPTIRTTLLKLKRRSGQESKNAKAEILDRQIEALSDATNAMLSKDPRLTAMDRSAIAAANILMCAPSRINEILSLRVTDRYSVDGFAERPTSQDAGDLFRAHQLMLTKGSKGASWTAKPILNFMIGLSSTCWDTMIALGERSRMLLKHYEAHPERLYLIPELEHLRGKPVTRRAFWKITNLSATEPDDADVCSSNSNWWTLTGQRNGALSVEIITIDNPDLIVSGRRKSPKRTVEAIVWADFEAALLKRVRERMASMRRISPLVHYDGPLSALLMLVDTELTPYLPQNWDYQQLIYRLNTSGWRVKGRKEKSVFIKLGLKMSQGGKLVDCYLNTHDPRRWLTTQALKAGERISDVLINKWANRVRLTQLPAYDLRSPLERATQAAPPAFTELQPISAGLRELESLEHKYGLSVDFVLAHGDGLAVTSFDAVCQATESRPVAQTGGQLIVLYPTRFGVCLHQHHELPCRAYSCIGCNELIAVKGHLPTNDEWRAEQELAMRSIVNQLQALIVARNRGIADDCNSLDAHLLTIVRALDAQLMAAELVARFHEIKDQIKDVHFRNELEEAFVTSGVVDRLDSPAVPSGAFIKYHSPTRHASPGYERSIATQFGGRASMEEQNALFYERHSQLAPKQMGLRDERHLLADDAEDGDERGQAA